MRTWDLRTGDPAIGYELDLSVVVLRNSGWSQDEVKETLREANRVLSQCGMQLARVRAAFVDPPFPAMVDTNSAEERALARALPASSSRPAVFFTRSEEEAHRAYSYIPADCSGAPWCQTVWLTHDIAGAAYKAAFHHGDYTLAHELGHVIGNTPAHRTDANVMADSAERTKDVVPAQCEAFKRYPGIRHVAGR